MTLTTFIQVYKLLIDKMLLPLKAVISLKVGKDGKSAIYYQYCFSSTRRVLLNTQIAIPKASWNAKRQCISKGLPTEFGDFNQLNIELGRVRQVIETIIEHGLSIGERNIGAYVKTVYKPDFKIDTLPSPRIATYVKKREHDFFSEIDDYILLICRYIKPLLVNKILNKKIQQSIYYIISVCD